jgi:CHAT domain-containing protein
MDWARTQNNLGAVLESLGDLTGDTAVVRSAEAAFRAAMAAFNDSGAEDTCQRVAGALARLLVRKRCYSDAAAVIERTLTRSDAALMDAARSRDGVRQAVGRVDDLYGLLSLCRLRQPVPDRAEALIAAESGRARLLADSQAFDSVQLEQINDPETHREIIAAQDRRAALRYRLGHRQGSGTELHPDEMLTVAARERLQAELREATDACVALWLRHGLIRTPESLSLAEILAAAPAGGALVLPVVTEADAFAFVVADGVDTPAVIDLPRLDRRAVTEHLLSGEDGWLGVYYAHFHQLKGGDATIRAAATARWHGQLTTTVAWLWERLLGPVHAHLCDIVRLDANAPVVMMAPGVLGLLPLHAAGPGSDGRHFGDYWTVSYAPSVRTLLTCRRKAGQFCTWPAKLLAIIDPPTQDREQELIGAQQEASMLEQRFAHAAQVILRREQATLAAVLAHLSSATHVHASTHGWHDPLQPMRSGLHLADTPLLLGTLREARLDTARLVFLSACESGRADIRQLPEEFIGLPAGFVQGGAACVIAALWPIRDDAAFLLACRFYELYLGEAAQERAPPVVALRAAVDWLRRVTFADLKQRFPRTDGPQGSVLVLCTAERFKRPIQAEPLKPAQKIEGIHLPLGGDDECPYGAIEHWAAFAVTGA